MKTYAAPSNHPSKHRFFHRPRLSLSPSSSAATVTNVPLGRQAKAMKKQEALLHLCQTPGRQAGRQAGEWRRRVDGVRQQ